MTLPLSLTLVLVGPTSCLLAQAPQWTLPARGAAIYQRHTQRTGKVLEARNPDRATWDIHLPLPPVAAMVLAAELDPKKQYIDEETWSLLQLPSRLALDVRNTKRESSRRLALRLHMGDLRTDVSVRHGRPDADGVQVIEAKFEGPNVEREQFHRGTIVIRRVFDAAAGHVAWFEAKTEVLIDLPENYPAKRIQQSRTERWEFERVVTAQSPWFKEKVREAIERGTAETLKDLTPTRVPGIYSGLLALQVLTAVKANTLPSHPHLRAALNDLRRRNIEKSYALSVALMAFEALYASPSERDMLISGRLKEPLQRKPTPEDLKLMQEWADRLLKAIDQDVDPAYLARFQYTPGRGFDNSNTQYALLGLYSALLSGVKVSRKIWFAAAKHWLTTIGARPGSERIVRLTPHRDVQSDGSVRKTRRTGQRVGPAGWGYRSSDRVYGSMTAAGITALTLCESALHRSGRLDRRLAAEMREARLRGFLWLSDHMTMRLNPGEDGRWRDEIYYYLYSVERACEFLQVARIDGRDWYFEGALQILQDLRDSKRDAWEGAIETCFAVLFLKRAVYGPITPPR